MIQPIDTEDAADPRLESDDEITRDPGSGLRGKILKSTAILPSLFTLTNGLLGFAAIRFATASALGDGRMHDMAIAAWCLFGAMVADMLDGRIARMTRRTSDFGAQLDSLCDMVTFGTVPAVLMICTVASAANQLNVTVLQCHEAGSAMSRLMWCIGGLYVACAALRLARFNAENDPDISAHMAFRGLPSPGAAAAIAGLVLLLEHLPEIPGGWRSGRTLEVVVVYALPATTLLVALLMVSPVPYVHAVNQYVHGRRPFSYLVKFVLLALGAVIYFYVTLAVVTLGYALSGPARWAFGKVTGRKNLA